MRSMAVMRSRGFSNQPFGRFGVHGEDLVHFSRGFSDDLWKAAIPKK